MLTTSPSLTLYSCKSLPSARALPLRRSRWASAGGAPGCSARRDLTAAMVSATLMLEMVYDFGGLLDLNVTVTVPGFACSWLGQMFVNVNDPLTCGSGFRASFWRRWRWKVHLQGYQRSSEREKMVKNEWPDVRELLEFSSGCLQVVAGNHLGTAQAKTL